MHARAAKLVMELAEEASERPELFPSALLDRLERAVGFDSAMLMGLIDNRPLAHRNKEASLAQTRRYGQSPQRYIKELARGREAARRDGGAYLDHEVFTADERRELPFFAEIIAPQGISSQLVAPILFRGRPLASLHLCRHGHSRRYADKELALLRALSPLLGLAHAAFMDGAPALEPLTPRERDVAQLVARGLSNREIGSLLGSSPNTVRNQLHQIYAKLGVAGRTELAVWAERAARK